MSAPTTLVTGATGFLGTHLIDRLIRGGADPGSIRAIARTSSARLGALGVQVCRGSILDERALGEALSGVERVYHLAGLVERDPGAAHRMYELHVGGTRRLLEAAAEAGVARLVYASTSGTVGVGTEPDFIARDGDAHVEQIVSGWPYYLSKIYAERAAWRVAQERELDLITLRPSILLGPGDERGSSTNDVLAFLRRQIPATPPGGLSFVDVRDVADAFVRAMERAPAHSTYLIGGHNMTLAAFFQILSSVSGVPAPTIAIPGRALSLGAKAIAGAMRTLGREAIVDPVSVEMGRYFWYVDASGARRDLGFQPRPADETLRDTARDLGRLYPDLAAPADPAAPRRAPPAGLVAPETIAFAADLRRRAAGARRGS